MQRFWACVLLALLIYTPNYMAYRLGRHLERKALTTYLQLTLNDECEECRKIGYDQAWQRFNNEYDTEPLNSGRY